MLMHPNIKYRTLYVGFRKMLLLGSAQVAHFVAFELPKAAKCATLKDTTWNLVSLYEYTVHISKARGLRHQKDA